jgi:hypothetical protein
MHKYEEQSVSRGGTDAQGIHGSIHTRHLVCMFGVVVRSRYRQTYVVQSHEWCRRWRIGLVLAELTERVVASTLPKNLIAPHLCKCSSADGDLGSLLSHSVCSHKVGRECAVCNSSENLFSCNQKQSHILRICTHAEGCEQTVTVVIRATVTASQKLTPSETSITSRQPLQFVRY